MRKRVLGAIAALTAGAGGAAGQMPAAAPPGGGLTPANYGVSQVYGAPLPGFPPAGPDVVPIGDPAMNGAPTYPPGGFYGSPPPGTGTAGGTVGTIAPKSWLNVEYLLWFVKAQPTRVPYVTTSSPFDEGLAGRPTTFLLFTDRAVKDLGYNLFSGFRISGGVWRGEDRRAGFEIGGFLLEQKSNVFFAASGSNGVPTLARPFVDATTGGNAAFTIASLGNASGNVLVASSTQLYGAEGNGLVNWYRSCPGDARMVSVSGLLGFKFVELEETLNVSSATTLLGGGDPRFVGQPVFAPGVIGVRDEFRALNRFYGGQVGLKAEAASGRWMFQTTLKVAFGVMNQRADIDGRSELLDPTRGINSVALGGVYANTQNIGRYRNDEFCIIPDVGASIGYNWSNSVTTFIGYNFLYIDNVIRPGNMVPRTVNSTLLPTSQTYGGAAVPTANPVLQQDDYWAQGVTFGILFRF